MKLLVVFSVVCLLLAGAVAWAIFGGLRADATVPALAPRSLAAKAVDERGTDSSPLDGSDAAATKPNLPAPELAEGPTSQPLVRWAGDPDRRAAGRRLQLAQATLREDPDHPVALRDQAEALAALGRWSEAADTLARRVKLDPENAALRFDYATALVQARRWVEAVSILQQIVQDEPQKAGAWFNLAVAHQAVGHLAAARAAWDRAIELTPTAEAFARRGEVLLDLHEWDAAAADFEAVLKEQPDAEDATLNRALALGKAGQSTAAQALLVDFVARHPCYVPALNRLAELALASTSAESPELPNNAAARAEAVRWWQRSLECDPGQDQVREALEHALK